MPNQEAFDHPIHKLWIVLDQSYVAASKCQEAAITKAGLTLQQYRVLMVLNAVKYPVTITDIARWLARNPNSISLIADRMEKVALVTRVRDLKDRRSLRLVMTPKGKDLVERANAYGLELLDRIRSCCTDEEIQILTNLLGRIREQALEELIPEESARVTKINGAKDIVRFMTKSGKGKKRNIPEDTGT